MTYRWTERQLIFRVMLEAAVNIDGLSDAYHRDPDEEIVQENEALLRAMDRFCLKYYGKTVHDHMNAPLKGAKLVPITEILSLMSQGGDGEIIEGEE